MTRLLVDLEKYEGQRIAVKGYLSMLGPNAALYPSQDLALIGDDASAIIVNTNIPRTVPWEVHIPCLNSYVGVFGELVDIGDGERFVGKYFVITNLTWIWSYSVEEAKKQGSPQMAACFSVKD